MNWRIIALCGVVGVRAAGGQTSGFVESLTPQEQQGAGLDRLTPAEKAALDALVARRLSGPPAASAPAPASTSAASPAPAQPFTQSPVPARTSGVAAPTPAPAAPPAVGSLPPKNPPELEEPSARAVTRRASEVSSAAEGGGWLNWIKPRTPRKEVPIIESQVAGKLGGWDAHSVFTLANGQRWAVSDYSMRSFVHPLDAPRVRITPNSIFGYVMEIPEVDLRIHVRPVN